MVTGRVISGSRPVQALMGRVWFKCNKVFSGFEVGPGIVIPALPCLAPPHPDYILKIFLLLFYLILEYK